MADLTPEMQVAVKVGREHRITSMNHPHCTCGGWPVEGESIMHTEHVAAEVVIALTLLGRDRRVIAEALEKAASDVGPALGNATSGHTSTRSVRHWLLLRAADIRAGRDE